MTEEDVPSEKLEDLQDSALALFEKSARLRKEADDMAQRARDLLEKARTVKTGKRE